MKLQSLAVIFAIIILPISLILGIYIDNQVETLRLQISYDSKLNNATYDALKTFQLNTINNSVSDLPESKIKDIEASANSFFNSIASNFNMPGYTRDVLKENVPALVYTMYDGYYIYSDYINTITEDDYENEHVVDDVTVQASTYRDGQAISGLKSYVYYSCRYQPNTSSDFVITYSLDNYITIKGIINNNPVDIAGYLIDKIGNEAGDISYRNVTITTEGILQEKLVESDGTLGSYNYQKVNGVKYYYDDDAKKWFSMLNSERIYTDDVYQSGYNESARKYYFQARDFRKKLNDYGISGLRTTDAVELNSDGSINTEIANKNGWRKL